MALSYGKPGANHVPSYQISALPYVTQSATNEVPNGTAIRHSLPYVTRFFIVRNTGAAILRVGFSEQGVKPDTVHNQSKNYFTLNPGSGSMRLDIRCKDLFFLGDGATTNFELIAGLTTIQSDQFPILTGSNGFKGVGGDWD